MMTRNRRVFVRYLLFPLLIIFALSGLAIAQAIPPLNPPAWSVGEWWTVECQVYDLGKIKAGATPGWRPKQAWRFQVEKIEELADQPYYVVSVTPIKGNSCPYSFRYWFRGSDRFVGRRELIHATPAPTKPRIIGPPTVTKDFITSPAAPFFSDEFPTLPVTMPLFNVVKKYSGFQATEGEQLSQEIEEASAAVMEKANPDLLAKIGKYPTTENVLIKVNNAANVSESQYWNSGLPFPVYGERFDQTYTSRRYWLVEMGKN